VPDLGSFSRKWRTQITPQSNRKGSLEPGKLADMVALSDDPFEIPVDALKDVRVETTIVGGRIVQEQ